MLLFKNIAYLIKNNATIIKDTHVLIKDNKIFKIGNAAAEYAGGDIQVIDASGKIMIPGFVNPHTHLYQSMLKNVTDKYSFKEWCENVTFPFANIIHKEHREHHNIDLGYYYASLGAMEMIRTGITCFSDFDITLDSLFEAWQDVGIRGIGAIQTVNRWIPKELLNKEDERKAELVGYIKKWHNKGILRVALGPSTPFACTEEYLIWLKNLAKEYDLQIQMHVSETSWEVKQSLDEYGNTPLKFLDDIGYLTEPICAIHCVHLTEEEIAIARDKHVSVVYNPKSNAKLGSGIAPIPRYLKEGILVGISTDGPASNDLIDMFEEMRFGILVQRAKAEDVSVMSAEEVFKMATENGAKILNTDAGVIEEGKLADIVLIDPKNVAIQPMHDVMQAVVYCCKSENVDTVVIDGKLILLNKRFVTINESEVLNKAIALANEKQSQIKLTSMAAEF